MEQSRPGHRYEDVIIRKKQPLLRFIVDLAITSIFWLYSIVVVYFFVSAIFNRNDKYMSLIKIAFKTNDKEIRVFLLTGVIIFLSFFLLLLLWRTYNKKKFGSLNRRREPGDTSLEDWENLGLIDKKMIVNLQQSKYIEFDKNPVRELG